MRMPSNAVDMGNAKPAAAAAHGPAARAPFLIEDKSFIVYLTTLPITVGALLKSVPRFFVDPSRSDMDAWADSKSARQNHH